MDSPNQRLKQWRESSKISRDNLAEVFKSKGKDVGSTYQAVKNLEDGKVKIKSEHLQILKSEYGVNPNWILEGEGAMYIELTDIVNESTATYTKPDINSLLRDLETKHPESQHIIRRLRDDLNELILERDSLRTKVIRAQEEIIKLIRKV